MLARDRSRVTFLLALYLIVATGLFVRLTFVLRGDFPIGDGGMFFTMVRDLQLSGYSLPEHTSYNNLDIPFTYPPLGFYVAGLLADLTPLDLIDVFRFLPLAVNMLTIGAFVLLARELLQSRHQVLIATFVFAILPRAYMWTIMAGGVTRSFGFFFAILGLWVAFRMYRRRQWRYAGGTMLLSALTVLSHIEMGWFLAFSIGFMFVAWGRSKKGVLHSIVVVVGSLALTAPWWAVLIVRHGYSPFLAASQTGSVLTGTSIIRLLVLDLTEEPLFPLLAATAIIGALACIGRRRYFLPVWVVGCILLDPRAYGTDITAPLAVLAAIGLTEVIVPTLSGTLQGAETETDGNTATKPAHTRSVRWLNPGLAGLAVAYIIFATLGLSPIQSLSRDERDAMRWAQFHTPEDSRFLIITSDYWYTDISSEWFPALAKRESIATIQGHEWLPGESFAHLKDEYDEAQECGDRTVKCVTEWSHDTGLGFDYLYISRQEGMKMIDQDACCWSLENSIRHSPEYRVVYDGVDAVIFEHQ